MRCATSTGAMELPYCATCTRWISHGPIAAASLACLRAGSCLTVRPRLWMTRRHRRSMALTMTMDSVQASDTGETLGGDGSMLRRWTVVAMAVLLCMGAVAAHADDTLKQFRLGLLGGENTQDRL